MFLFLRYKITDHRNFIPGFNTNFPFSPDELPFFAVNQRFIPKHFLAMLRNNRAIIGNKTFIPYNKSIIPGNKPIISGNETNIPENNSKILWNAFNILRYKLVIPENIYSA